MSENKGKAKVKSKSKSKSTMKSAGKNKAAVMNSRNPKKPMAISGDTMSNYAMYKAGGVKKYGMGGPGDDPVKSAGTGDKVKMLKDLYDKYLGPKKSININNTGDRKPEKKLLAKRGGKIKSKK
jgi:hypothetical protein